MRSIKVSNMLSGLLCLGLFAQSPAKAAESDPVVSISTGQLRGSPTSGNTGYEYQFSRTVHGKEAQGAPHASEIPFIFGTLPVWQNMRKYNDSDRGYAPQMQEYWTNFAKTGDPNGGNLAKWPKFDAAARAYMDFTDAGPVAKEGLRRQACDGFIENQKRQGL
jgi:para-nitrobenzyl esterase